MNIQEEQQLQQLLAVSPIDGRYMEKTQELREYFSEYALIKYRVKIEIEYFIQLSTVGIVDVNQLEIEQLRNLYTNFRIKYAQRVKEIERVTNHDVKAIEYFLKEICPHPDNRFFHFGLTSQDINTSATMLQIKDAKTSIFWTDKIVFKLINVLQNDIAQPYQNLPMLSRTHGQPASPTTLGREFMVYVERLNNQIAIEDKIVWQTKFGGAVGNFSALKLAYPEIDWQKFGDNFCHSLGLVRSNWTTQIDHYDGICAHFDNYKRINTILIDLCQDIWTYISLNYFKLRIIKTEVGSSAMPHKVNPIDFENAEGNFKMANTMFEFFTRKLPISRLQRDLTDSTVLRNVGVAFGHTLIGFKPTQF